MDRSMVAFIQLLFLSCLGIVDADPSIRCGAGNEFIGVVWVKRGACWGIAQSVRKEGLFGVWIEKVDCFPCGQGEGGC